MLFEQHGKGRGKGFDYRPVPVDSVFRDAFKDRLMDGVLKIASTGSLDLDWLSKQVANPPAVLYRAHLVEPFVEGVRIRVREEW